MANVAKFFALVIGVIGAIVIALLTGVFGVIELLLLWPLMLIMAPALDLTLGLLERESGDPVFVLTQLALQHPLISGRIGQEVFISWIWTIARPKPEGLGSYVEINTEDCRPHSPQDSVFVVGNHPTMEAATGLSKALMSHFYGPVRWVIKWELMLWFAPVILPFLAAGAGYPLVRESKWLSRWVLRWFGAIRYGLIAIFPDGTRPAEKKGRAAQEWLREHDQSEHAVQWDLPLALPRPGGVRVSLAKNPTARLVLAVTSGGTPGKSVVADFWGLVFGPQTIYKVWLIDLDRQPLDEAAAQGDAVLGRLLVQIWLKEVFPRLRAGGTQPMGTEE